MMPSVQFNRSVVSNSLWPHEPQHTSLPVHHQLPESTQTHVHWVSDAIQPSHPLDHPLLLPSIFPSIWVFSNESALHIRWPKYWTFSFNISPSNEHPGLISFRMDWLGLLTAQETQESSATPQFKAFKITFVETAKTFLYNNYNIWSIHLWPNWIWNFLTIYFPLVHLESIILNKLCM